MMKRLQVIDSHTAGEPTRVVVAGGPGLPCSFLREQLAVLRERHDWLRSAVVTEPRGSDVMVGALLCEPMDRSCTAGVIFFNNVGYLGMCGHGAIGVAVTLAHLGRISPGEHRFETPVGIVKVFLEDRNTVSLENVESYRTAGPLTVDVPGFGPVTGDVAWGGNWFFLVEDHGQDLTLSNVPRLRDFTLRIRQALAEQGITGRGGAEIDHIELLGPPTLPEADSRNFVLCPGGAYDRSPCGTGTSAKLACLHHDGKLKAGETWRQESIIGSVFEGSVTVREGHVYPRIRGKAYVNGECTLLLDPQDPFATGIRA
jgi:4-hydroxyproline epimerase